ncbi:MAG: hypothetical protein WDN27_00075 [Candidatus Saccharibacteria bacterium]
MRAALRRRLPRTFAGQILFSVAILAIELVLTAVLAHLRSKYGWQ